MDLLHRPSEFQFISDEISVREFFEQAVKSLSDCNYAATYDVDQSEENNLANQIGCSVSVIREIAGVCNVDNLKSSAFDDWDPLRAEVPSSSNLMTSEIQRRELEKRAASLTYKQMQAQMQKFKRYNFKLLESFSQSLFKENIPANYTPSDVLLTVFLTKPYNKPLEKYEIRLGRLLSADCAFYVMGNQKLSTLRDKITCLSDWSVMQDFSNDPDKPQDVLSKDVYKSGYFYINGVFYNDLRAEEAEDLSEEVISWATRRPREILKMTKADMNDTTFLDLNIRLGQPYLYFHQGTCEHLLIFTDLRLMHPSDCHDMAEYPLQILYKSKKRAACCACKVYTARWVVFEHRMLPFDPGFFCDACFRSFNYDKSGKKVCDFKALPYFDRSVI